MFAIPCKKRIIYLQIILFLLGSFSLLVQNAMASGCHLRSVRMEMSMPESMLMKSMQTKHGTEKCCDSCNCIGQHCMLNCSMLYLMAAFINTGDSVPLYTDNPINTIPAPVGISSLPERQPPRQTVL